jgi:hypothetical protein
LQALLIWQLLNKSAAAAQELDDARFTRHFMVVAPGLIVYERLLDAFCGKLVAGGAGSRDFNTSDLARFADLLVPEVLREQVFAFIRGKSKYLCSQFIAFLNFTLHMRRVVSDEPDTNLLPSGLHAIEFTGPV